MTWLVNMKREDGVIVFKDGHAGPLLNIRYVKGIGRIKIAIDHDESVHFKRSASDGSKHVTMDEQVEKVLRECRGIVKGRNDRLVREIDELLEAAGNG